MSGRRVTPNTFNTDFISKHFHAVAVLHPQRIHNSPIGKLILEVASAAQGAQSLDEAVEQVKEHTGIDGTKVHEIVGVLGVLPGEESVPIQAMVVRFDEPYDRSAIESKFRPGMAKEAMYGGRRYLKDPYDSCLCCADDKTLLMAREEGLRAMLDTTPEESSPLLDILKGMDNDSDLFALITIDQSLAKKLGEGAPTSIAAFAKAMQKAKHVTLQANLSGGTLATWCAKMIDAQSAADANAIVGLFRSSSALNPEQLKAAIIAQDVPEATADELVQLAADLRNGLSYTVQDDTFSAVLKAPPDLASRIESLGPALVSAGRNAAIETARASTSLNNLRNLGLAQYLYENRKLAYAGDITSPTGEPLLSWRVRVLPDLELGDLYKKFKLDEPWDSPHNKALLSSMPPVFAAPGDEELARESKTCYMVPVGKETIFPPPGSEQKTLSSAYISAHDGTASTLLMVEVDREHAVEWTRPGDLQVDLMDPKKGLAIRRGSFLVAFADTHVRKIKSTVEDEVLALLFTPWGRKWGQTRSLNHADFN